MALASSELVVELGVGLSLLLAELVVEPLLEVICWVTGVIMVELLLLVSGMGDMSKQSWQKEILFQSNWDKKRSESKKKMFFDDQKSPSTFLNK